MSQTGHTNAIGAEWSPEGDVLSQKDGAVKFWSRGKRPKTKPCITLVRHGGGWRARYWSHEAGGLRVNGFGPSIGQAIDELCVEWEEWKKR